MADESKTNVNQEWRLASYPSGDVLTSHMKLVDVPMPEDVAEDGNVLIAVQYLSVDPYMRGVPTASVTCKRKERNTMCDFVCYRPDEAWDELHRWPGQTWFEWVWYHSRRASYSSATGPNDCSRRPSRISRRNCIASCSSFSADA